MADQENGPTWEALVRIFGERNREHQCELIPLDNPDIVCAKVMGFGHVIFSPDNADEVIQTHGPGHARRVPLTHVDGENRAEMLHKADRICVVFRHVGSGDGHG